MKDMLTMSKNVILSPAVIAMPHLLFCVAKHFSSSDHVQTLL